MRNRWKSSTVLGVLSILLVSGCGTPGAAVKPAQKNTPTLGVPIDSKTTAHDAANAVGALSPSTTLQSKTATPATASASTGTQADNHVSTSSAPSAATSLNINGSVVMLSHPIQQRSGIWFVPSDEMTQIFGTYVDTSDPAHVVVNLRSIATLDFSLQTPSVMIGNNERTLTVGAFRQGDVVYLPIQTIADQCGVKVEYNETQHQLAILSNTLRFQLPLTGDGTLQTVIMPGSDPQAPTEILDAQGHVLFTTAGQKNHMPFIGLQTFNVGAPAPLVLWISQGGTGGQLYTACMYDAKSHAFQPLNWGNTSSASILGFVEYAPTNRTIRLSDRVYDAVQHLVTTPYKWVDQPNSSIGELERTGEFYGPPRTSSQLPESLDPGMILSAALTSVAEHLPAETPIYFADTSDGVPFYKEWSGVLPFGNTLRVDLTQWSSKDATEGKTQSVIVTTDENALYKCSVSFEKQAGGYRIKSIELNPVS